MVQSEVELLLEQGALSLKELSVIYDCYYKSGISQGEHNQKVAEHIIIQKYNAGDFMRELTLNESLRFFRGLFFLEGLPYSLAYAPVFKIYEDLVKNHIGEKLNMSTWLTVIETSRHVADGGLRDLLEYSKKQFEDNFTEDVFNTEGKTESSLQAENTGGRSARMKRPKSVLKAKKAE